MKTLICGSKVSARSYYYLLDWNDSNKWKYLSETFNKKQLSFLTREEYKKLFEHATTTELNLL